MYDFTCKYCGKEHKNVLDSGYQKVFCNRQCWNAHREQRKAEAPAKARARDAAGPLVPPSKCRRCVYRIQIGTETGCNYLSITGHSRLSLHPDGLTPDCQEFKPRPRTHKYQAERR